jgi:hypothetical protein
MSSSFTADFLARLVLLGVVEALVDVSSGDSSTLTAFLLRELRGIGVAGGLESCNGSCAVIGDACALSALRAELLVDRTMLEISRRFGRWKWLLETAKRDANSSLKRNLIAMVVRNLRSLRVDGLKC